MLTKRLILDRPENLKRYRAILRELLQGPCAPERVLSRLDSIFQEIKPAALEDPFKLARTADAWLTEVHDMRSYIRTYSAALQAELARGD